MPVKANPTACDVPADRRRGSSSDRTADVAVRVRQLHQAFEAARIRHGDVMRASSDARWRRIETAARRRQAGVAMAGSRSASRGDSRRAAAAMLEAAFNAAGMALGDLWVDYFALGGEASQADLARMLSGEEAMDGGDHDRLALALNERLTEAGLDSPLAFWDGTR